MKRRVVNISGRKGYKSVRIGAYASGLYKISRIIIKNKTRTKNPQGLLLLSFLRYNRYIDSLSIPRGE